MHALRKILVFLGSWAIVLALLYLVAALVLAANP